MRVTARATAAILAAAIALGCAGCGQPPARSASRPGTATCWQSAVRAIQRHVIIRSVPRSCAGLTGAELGVVVAWAVRAAGGAHAKAAQRRVAAADSRYLASLVRASASLAAAAPATPGSSTAASGGAAAALAPGAGPGADGGLGLAALGCWAVTAAVGGYLFRSHRRPAALARRPPAVAAGHAGVALAGLALWTAAAVAPGSAALAWSAAALVIGAAGLGLAVLLTAAPESAPAAPGARPAPPARRVLAVASHIGLAVATMLLVLLAATGRS